MLSRPADGVHSLRTASETPEQRRPQTQPATKGFVDAPGSLYNWSTTGDCWGRRRRWGSVQHDDHFSVLLTVCTASAWPQNGLKTATENSNPQKIVDAKHYQPMHRRGCWGRRRRRGWAVRWVPTGRRASPHTASAARQASHWSTAARCRRWCVPFRPPFLRIVSNACRHTASADCPTSHYGCGVQALVRFGESPAVQIPAIQPPVGIRGSSPAAMTVEHSCEVQALVCPLQIVCCCPGAEDLRCARHELSFVSAWSGPMTYHMHFARPRCRTHSMDIMAQTLEVSIALETSRFFLVGGCQ